MRSNYRFAILGLALSFSVVALSLSVRAQSRTSAQLTPESQATLEAFEEATKKGASAGALQGWLTKFRATTSVKGTDTTVKVALSLSNPGPPPTELPGPEVRAVSATCLKNCPSSPNGTYKTKLGKIVDYECTGLQGCQYNQAIGKWTCNYRMCSFIKRDINIVPQ